MTGPGFVLRLTLLLESVSIFGLCVGPVQHKLPPMRLGWAGWPCCLLLLSSCDAGSGDLLGPPPLSLQSLLITPARLMLAPEGRAQLRVVGLLNDQDSLDLTSSLGTTYTSEAPDIAEVTARGEVLAKQPGQTELLVAHLGIQARVTVTVENLVRSISITPDTAQLVRGQPLQFSVFGERLDGVSTNLLLAPEGAALQLSSDNERVVTIDAEGLALARGPGSAQLIARIANIETRAAVTVLDHRLAELNVSPDPVVLEEGARLQMSVIGRFEDGHTEDLSDFQSGTVYRLPTDGAMISSIGYLEGLTAGTEATLTVTNGGRSVEVPLRVIAPVESLEVIELDRTKPGGIGRYQIVGRLPGDATLDLSDNEQLETIIESAAIATAQNGVFFGHQVGSTTLTARWGQLQAQAELHVEDGADPVTLLRWAHGAASVRVGQPLRVRLDAVRESGAVENISDAQGLILSTSTTMMTSPDEDSVSILGLAAGDHVVEAFFEGHTAHLPVRVQQQLAPETLRLVAPALLNVTEEVELSLLGYGQDGAWMGELEPNSRVISHNPIVEVIGPMRVRGVFGGFSMLSLSRAGLEAHLSLRVVSSPFELTGLRWTTNALSLAVEQSAHVTLLGTFADDVQADLSDDPTRLNAEVFGPIRLELNPQRLTVVRLGPGLAALRATLGSQRAVMLITDEP